MRHYLTHKEMLVAAVKRRPGQSAYELSLRLGLKSPDVSSTLKRMCDKGQLRRVDGDGPNGGFGYYPL